MLKYELILDDTLEIDGITVYRIKALRDFSDVKKDDLGGYIANEGCLSHSGDCWVYDKSNKVLSGEITGNAIVNGFGSRKDNIIDGNIKISGNAKIVYEVDIYGRVELSDNCLVSSVPKPDIRGADKEPTVLDGCTGKIIINGNARIIGSNLKPRTDIKIGDNCYLVNAVISNVNKDYKAFHIGGKTNKSLTIYNGFYTINKLAFSDIDGLHFFGEIGRDRQSSFELVYKETAN